MKIVKTPNRKTLEKLQEYRMPAIEECACTSCRLTKLEKGLEQANAKIDKMLKRK